MFPDVEILKQYFQKSMDYFNNYSRIFRKRFPQVAQGLDMTESKVEDPDVIQLFKAFAMFDARLNWNIDQNKNLIGDFLLSIICPELLSPIPSACIVEMSCSEAYGSMRIPKSTELLSANNCRFKTGLDFELFHGKLEECEIVDTRYLEANYPFKKALSLELKIENYSPSILLYLNLEYESASRIFRLLLDQNVYLNGERIGSLSLPEGTAAFTSSSICGNPYYEIYEYRILREKFCFLRLDLLKRLEKGVYKLFLSADELTKTEIHPRMLLANCLPIVNLFSKKSDPIKLDLMQEEYELFADADRELYKIYSIENLYIYESSERSIPLEPNRDYFVRREQEKVFISIKSKFELKNPEKKVIYADVNCSNMHIVDEIKIADSLSVDRIPWLKAKILTKPTKSFFLRRDEKWPFLNLFTQNFISRNDSNLANILSDVCKLYDLELHGILEVSRKHAYGIRKTDFMWRGVFAKEVFEIKIATDSEFILALLLARVLMNCASIGSFAEVKILSADGSTLKLIEEQNEG